MMDISNTSDIDGILDFISQERACDTQNWYQVLIAFKNCGGSYDRFEAWSLCGRYENNHSQIRRAWDNVNGGYSAGSLILFAREDSPDFDAALFSNIESASPHQSIPADYSGRTSGPVNSRPEPLIENPDMVFNQLIRDYMATASEEELRAKSPLSLDDSDPVHDTILVLTHSYAPDEPVYIGKTHPDYPWTGRPYRTLTAEEKERLKLEYQKNHIRTASEWIEALSGENALTVLDNPLIRPNPLSGELAETSDGKPSYIADACVDKFRLAVVEFDGKPLSEQIAFWMAMVDRNMPVATIIHSGSKSVHGWLKVGCDDRNDWRENVEDKLFRQYLEPIGVDGQCKNPGRLSRLPGHYRSEKSQRQRLLYLNPEILALTPKDTENGLKNA